MLFVVRLVAASCFISVRVDAQLNRIGVLVLLLVTCCLDLGKLPNERNQHGLVDARQDSMEKDLVDLGHHDPLLRIALFAVEHNPVVGDRVNYHLQLAYQISEHNDRDEQVRQSGANELLSRHHVQKASAQTIQVDVDEHGE